MNHLETWFDEGSLRASTIVAAKINEIEKELELRLHLHEPRHKRVEMDVHNVRACKLLVGNSGFKCKGLFKGTYLGVFSQLFFDQHILIGTLYFNQGRVGQKGS